jgi:hypothetical protein
VYFFFGGVKGEIRTCFNVAGGIDDTSSGTSSSNIDTDVMVNMYMEVIVRTCHSQYEER